MSRLSRDILRRDKAYELLESVTKSSEETKVLNASRLMTTILKDIKPKNITKMYNGRKLTPVWETIGVVAQIASHEEIWSVPVQSTKDYLPNNNPTILLNISAKWEALQKSDKADAIDFLNNDHHDHIKMVSSSCLCD